MVDGRRTGKDSLLRSTNHQPSTGSQRQQVTQDRVGQEAANGGIIAAGKPAELRIHLKGAIANGCSREELQDVLLLVALYCGLPAANEAHNAAVELFGDAAKDGDK